MINELDELARKYGTDKMCNVSDEKQYHGYTIAYYDLLRDYKNKPVNLLEMGVREGWSHLMWYDFFLLGNIYGLDNFSDPLTKDVSCDRIKIAKGSQDDGDLLDDLFDGISLDIIIDDASHYCAPQQKSFYYLWSHLSFGGFYFIEDIATSFDPKFLEFEDFGCSTVGWVQTMITKNPHSYYIPSKELLRIQKEIQFIQAFGELLLIKKVSK